MAPPRLLAGLLLSLACAPQSADRASLTGPSPVNPQKEQTDARTNAASAGGPADARGTDGVGGVVDARIDRAAPNLAAAGVRLLGAAIDWALLP